MKEEVAAVGAEAAVEADVRWKEQVPIIFKDHVFL